MYVGTRLRPRRSWFGSCSRKRACKARTPDRSAPVSIPNFHPAGFLSTGVQTVELPLADLSTRAGKLLLTLAMAAIGLEVDIRLLGGVGARAVTTGLVVTTILAVASLAMVTILI